MKKSRKPPYFSVVICSYNGAQTIERAINSLEHQDYPKNLYEIIVVDDGSIDETASISRRHALTLIRLRQNQGLSVARNAGLKAACGGVYVVFDDDCVADNAFLSQLAIGYLDGRAVGVSGSLVSSSTEPTRLISRYMNAQDIGPSPVSALPGKVNAIGRFTNYILSMLKQPVVCAQSYTEVVELYGANGSFPVQVLREVDGWDAGLSGIEDRDLSNRIKQHYPDRPFYAMANAKILHDPDMSLTKYLLRPYRRGQVNLEFYRRNNITPPVYPFPVLLLFAVIVALALNLWLALFVLVALPQLLYFWWLYRGFIEKSYAYLLFAYIQVAEETMVISGLLRGYFAQLRGFNVSR